ncbi:hypothetical protein CCU_09880 [Coprococcus sp. ART55/1]|nr:hypothetical protein CCU_09880 [Coprococcus sp. ART55/1]
MYIPDAIKAEGIDIGRRDDLC